MLVLLVGLLVLLHPGTVEAGTHGGGSGSTSVMANNCVNCAGDWQSKHADYINDIYRWNIIAHHQYADGTSSCSHDAYGVGANGDKLYMIRYDCLDSLQIGYIYISNDEKIEFHDSSGNIVTNYLSDYESSNYGGECNGKTYGNWIYFFVDKPYEINYCDGFDFIVDAEDLSFEEQKHKSHEIARYLCGESTNLPDGVTIGKSPEVYDLEAPLGVTVTSSDNSRNFQIHGDGLYQGSDLVIPYKIWWNQSNIDLTGYETEFYVREYGKYKKSLFSSWVDVMTPYLFDKSFVTAKYCNNSLKYYEFSPKDKKRIYQYCTDEAGEEPYAVEFYHPDFMLRNRKEDENGQMHYSNWVYVKTYDDGTYSVFEMEQEYDLEEDPDETGNIDVDSPNYDDEIIYEDTDYSPDIGGVKDSAKFITVLKDLANSLGDFPDLFAQIFSFLPSWVLVCIGTLFVVIMLKGIF